MYTAGVTTNAAHAAQAHRLIDLLTSGDQRTSRIRAGFLDAHI
jgi:molybdate transport system substrate-binding protein